MTSGPEVHGSFTILQHCTFQWRQSHSLGARDAFIEDHHCQKCVEELQKRPGFRIVDLRSSGRGAGSTEIPVERRKESRHAVVLGLMIPASSIEGEQAKGRWVNVLTANVSRGGMALLAPVSLVVGMDLTIAVPIAGVVVGLPSTIRHCTATTDSSAFLVGLEFTSLDAPQRRVVDALLAAAKTASR
jgi:hypothetical protein